MIKMCKRWNENDLHIRKCMPPQAKQKKRGNSNPYLDNIRSSSDFRNLFRVWRGYIQRVQDPQF